MSLLDYVGNPRGRYSDKNNRAAKLISIWDDLTEKFSRMTERGNGESDTARHAYGLLLMMETGIRVGNESSAEGWISENQIVARKSNKEKGIKKGDVIWQHEKFGELVQTYGLTTLLNKHVRLKKDKLILSFTGKKLVDQRLTVKNDI